MLCVPNFYMNMNALLYPTATDTDTAPKATAPRACHTNQAYALHLWYTPGVALNTFFSWEGGEHLLEQMARSATSSARTQVTRSCTWLTFPAKVLLGVLLSVLLQPTAVMGFVGSVSMRRSSLRMSSETRLRWAPIIRTCLSKGTTAVRVLAANKAPLLYEHFEYEGFGCW